MEIIYHLHNRGEAQSIARGHVKYYETAGEAIDRLLERLGTAIVGELVGVDGPIAPWQLVLNLTIADQGDGPPQLKGYGSGADQRLDGIGRATHAH